jgi:hypothetical protein
MTRIILTAILLIISKIAIAQVSENRTISSFSEIQIANIIEVQYTVSNELKLTVSTDDEEKLKRIKTEVSNNKLSIYVEQNEKTKKVYSNDNKEFNNILVTISGPNLEKIEVGSLGKINFTNTNQSDKIILSAGSLGGIIGVFEGKNAIIDVGSLGKINATLQNFNQVDIEASSLGQITLVGITQSIKVDASSTADCNLKNLAVENAIINASSIAKVSVNVSKSIKAAASSSAKVDYYGNAETQEFEESTSGKIRKKN